MADIGRFYPHFDLMFGKKNIGPSRWDFAQTSLSIQNPEVKTSGKNMGVPRNVIEIMPLAWPTI